MNDPVVRIEERLQRLEQAVDALHRRIQALETRAPVTGTEYDGAVAAIQPVAGAGTDRSVMLSLVGRTFMVFGGAFLLRALTSSGQVPWGAGIVAGLAYALVWLAAADRAAGRGGRLSGTFHGGAALAIGFPLVWEASTRFDMLAPTAGAAALATLTGVALAVARHRQLRALAVLAMIGAVITAMLLVRSTGQFIPFSVLLTLLGVATLWIGYARDWFWLGWAPALVADALVAGLAVRTLSSESSARPGLVIGTQMLLFASYVGSVAVRTLAGRREVSAFEVVQTFGAVIVGLVGAIAVAHRSGVAEAQLGIVSMLLGAGSYGVAIAHAQSRQEQQRNSQLYSALALILTLAGCGVLLRGAALAVLLAGLAGLTAWLGYRLGRSALVIHAAAYATVAAGVCGLLPFAVAALVATPVPPGTLGPAAWITLAATALCLILPRPRASPEPAAVAALPRMLMALLLVLESSAIVIASITPLVAGTPPDAGAVATLRTAVLAAAAVLLAGARRWERTAELGSLLYPILCLIGLKLLVEDFRYSEPVLLFVALGLFGVALVLTARLVRRGIRNSQGSLPGGSIERR